MINNVSIELFSSGPNNQQIWSGNYTFSCHTKLFLILIFGTLFVVPFLQILLENDLPFLRHNFFSSEIRKPGIGHLHHIYWEFTTKVAVNWTFSNFLLFSTALNGSNFWTPHPVLTINPSFIWLQNACSFKHKVLHWK